MPSIIDYILDLFLDGGDRDTERENIPVPKIGMQIIRATNEADEAVFLEASLTDLAPVTTPRTSWYFDW
tara:strand:- start:1935 stop:2141 length:207 start_codon:yes stop_codon:yes gene_type:complete